MNANDELRELWCSQPSVAAATKEELVELVQKKAREFDRKIFQRNLRECLAAVVVTALFAWMAFHAVDALQRTGLLIVAASGLWIIFFILRYGRASAPADPGQDLYAYRRDLVERYYRQIRLLKSVMYWYLLPPWLGLILNSAGLLMRDLHRAAPVWPDVVSAGIYSACFAFVWWLNGGPTVARLRARRAQILALSDDAALPGDSFSGDCF